MFRKLLVVSVVLTLAVAFSSLTASASSSMVTLSFPSTGTITFAGNGGSPIMTIAGPNATEPFSGQVMPGATGIFAGSTTFSLSGGPITFTQTGPQDYAGMGTLVLALSNGLTGTISNITLSQLGQRVTLSGDLSGSGQVSLNLDLQFGTPLSKLKPPHETETGTFGSGFISSNAVTPEPGTMLLFGSGLLAFATLLRRKILV